MVHRRRQTGHSATTELAKAIQRSIRRSQTWTRAGMVRNVTRRPSIPSHPRPGVYFAVVSAGGGRRKVVRHAFEGTALSSIS